MYPTRTAATTAQKKPSLNLTERAPPPEAGVRTFVPRTFSTCPETHEIPHCFTASRGTIAALVRSCRTYGSNMVIRAVKYNYSNWCHCVLTPVWVVR
jgi:hypothetical protein